MPSSPPSAFSPPAFPPPEVPPRGAPYSLRRAPRYVLTRWDVREAGRATGFAALALFFAWLVTAATDEGGVAWTERAARVLPLAPACAALGTWLGQAPGWARGEGRVFASLGRAPLAASASSVLGGAGVAWAVALAIALAGRVDVGGFFPVARAPRVFLAEPGGAFLDAASGYLIEPDGTLVAPRTILRAPAALETVPSRGRAAAGLATGLAGLALPLLVARSARGSWLERGAVALLASAASVFLFQAAAVRLVGPLMACLPSLLLLLWAGLRSDGARLST
jgi:hypothetical protein